MFKEQDHEQGLDWEVILTYNLFSIVMKTQHKNFRLNYFELYSLVVLSIFTLFCNQSPELCRLQNGNSVPIK